MIRPTSLTCACCLAALALGGSLPLAAQEQSGGFSLPQSSPTPTPAPQGPVDERAGVVIPPRSAPPPRIAPAPVLTPEPEVTLSPRPQPTTPRAAPSVGPNASTQRPPAPAGSPDTAVNSQPSGAALTGDPLGVPPALPLPPPDAPATAESTPLPAEPTLPAASAWLAWWPWAAGGLGGLAAIGLGALLWRRRKPKALRLAAPPEGMTKPAIPLADAPLRTAAALDVVLEVTGATRSLMMFTLHYRLTLANRTGQAVSDVNLAVLLACARTGADHAATAGAAQQLDRFDRIGPHQNLAMSGAVQLPLSAIAPLHQGRTPLFIPLVHVTLEAEGQSALTRCFVIGTPSAAGTGRLHPIPLDTPPGSINGLIAQRIAVPALSAAA